MSDANDTDESENRATEWAATTSRSWGRGYSERGAIMNALGKERVDPERDHPVTIAVWKVYVDDWQKIGPTGIDADEPLEFREYELDPDHVAEVHGLSGRLDRATDDMMADAEMVRQNDLAPDVAE